MSVAIQSISAILHGIVIILLIFIHNVIRKARLHNNQYYLIRILSVMDTGFSANAFIYVVLLLCQIERSKLSLVFGFGGYLFHALSMKTVLLLAIDRYIAVKYCLHYELYVTKRRINMVVGSLVVLTILVLSGCYFFDQSDITSFSWHSTYAIVVYLTTVRFLVCAIILQIGRRTLQIRNEKERTIKTSHVIIHGENAENLSLLKVLKRSIKDIIMLNYWTCFFILPMAVSSTLMLFGIGVNSKYIALAIYFLHSLHSLTNPIIYIFCFSKIRNYLFPNKVDIVKETVGL